MEWNTTSAILTDLQDFRNQESWRCFVGRFRPAILGFHRRMGLAAEDAEDATQATLLAFASAFKEGRYERPRGGLRRWLFAIAWRKAMDHLRQSNKSRAIGRREDIGELEDFANSAEVEETWRREWWRATLEQCLDRIRENVRAQTFTAFRRFALESVPASIVAHELGMTVNAVYVAKHRVLQRLMELVKEVEHLDQ